jgi:hypothetical protein
MAGKERRSKEHTIESESVILMALLESEYEDLERNLGSKLTSQSHVPTQAAFTDVHRHE